MKDILKIFSVILAAALTVSLASCGGASTPQSVRVFVLTGPTGMGAVNLWDMSDSGKTAQKYDFTAITAPDKAVAKLSSGEADIAAISTNLAAKLYKKTGGGVKILAVNTLGVLSVLDNTGAKINTMSDLRGRKIVTTGQGANPQYIIEYLLCKNGLDPEKDVTIEYKADGSELVSVLATEPDDIIIAPAPVSTSILMKFTSSKKVLDLTDEWAKCADDSALMMGCIVVRTAFLEEYPDAVVAFMEDYKSSIKKVSDYEKTGELCEKYGIVPKAAVAAKALDDAHICFITGDEMVSGLTGYLKVLFDADPATIGGMPDEGIWYK